ncbi:MAG: hypothetical protein EA400_17225 [Chromatiaceae bacterium]|nr:MAG: hypothetical protein EA400_17225 [Chromatiaceae bacterium]
MDSARAAHRLLDQEARALLTRVARIRPFVLNEPMLPAAALLPPAQIAIERLLAQGRYELKAGIGAFLRWLHGPAGRAASPALAQRRFIGLRLRFNAVLTQLDLFSDVITQRSESDNGVWMSGLDVVSADGLAVPGYLVPPPVICYLDRGIGAAIRRARTRLPGGGKNPVAIIRIPRERMIGSGIASSLFHEVGHQAAALLDLVPSLMAVLKGEPHASGDAQVWFLFERWLSEILADLWSVARVGLVSTLGLIGVVSLPRAFVFRLNLDDPHPMPWLRVKISCAIGAALYPHPQWARTAGLWQGFYPLDRLDPARRDLIGRVEATLPEFIGLVINHRPAALQGRSLREVLDLDARQPARLLRRFETWRTRPALLYRAPPALAFAVLGQAKADGRLRPEDEAKLLARLLTHWAMRSTLDTKARCAGWAATPARAALH